MKTYLKVLVCHKFFHSHSVENFLHKGISLFLETAGTHTNAHIHRWIYKDLHLEMKEKFIELKITKCIWKKASSEKQWWQLNNHDKQTKRLSKTFRNIKITEELRLLVVARTVSSFLPIISVFVIIYICQNEFSICYVIFHLK